MTDAQDLARRYLALWEEYLTALLSDPGAMPLLWGSGSGGPAPDDPGSDTGPAFGAATTAGASEQCCGSMAELARRVAVLEERIALLERERTALLRPRRRNRRVRA